MFGIDISGKVGERKYTMGLFCLTLVFILALFNCLNEVVSKCIMGVYVIAVGGNVGSKLTAALQTIFGKSNES
jgi:hypothetical protein